MSESEYGEPWEHGLKSEFETYHANTIYDSDKNAVCHVLGIAMNRSVEKESKCEDAKEGMSKARRIVACVNALAGIPTADLPNLAAENARLRDELRGIGTKALEFIQGTQEEIAWEQVMLAVSMLRELNKTGDSHEANNCTDTKHS
ncbi:MAG: hypothetical protein E6R03_03680 [Hyphomicrobiaceae bacterium]|nr:MAG: hypothetical protein E6R03_03680 [Hyphomicrobiaceae bacterium]